VATKPASSQTAVLLAPADEYFGPLKESYIGMRNVIRDLGLRYDVNHDIPNQTLASAELTERAVREWERKYPRDTQIPKTIFLLQRLYTKVLTQVARDHAHATAQWLFADYAKSPQARQLRKTLAMEHLAPLPDPSPTPTPVAPPVPTLADPSGPPGSGEQLQIPAPTPAPSSPAVSSISGS
jgi:hypothetical protein